MTQIDWALLAKAKEFYSKFLYKEVPWLVDEEVIRVTLPAQFENRMGANVGSGEQGFIQLMKEGKLSYGWYQTITPCFRTENFKELSDMTRLHFMKLELCVYLPSLATPERVTTTLEDVIGYARHFFDRHLPMTGKTYAVTRFAMIDGSSDLYYKQVELGSYGVRRWGDHLWVYGTGLAEPRFSAAKAKYGVSL